jgi:hypothetical protein
MTAKIVGTILSIGVCALISGSLFPPGDVPRQLFVVAMWYITGLATMAMWQS